MLKLKIKRMKIFTKAILLIVTLSMFSCASGYKAIAPKSINYISKSETNDVVLEYKYNLLNKKYAKKEEKKGVKLVAVKITNNTNRDLILGRDLNLVYENGNTVNVLENDRAFSTLKQSPASYLWYLLLTPVNLYTSETNSRGVQETTSSTPIGLILGPGLAGGNMIAAGSANTNFKKELSDFNIYGEVIKQGEVKYGLIGIMSNSYESLKLNLE